MSLSKAYRERLALAAQLDRMLTCKERQVVQALANGETARMIAARLGISQNTVNKHVGHIVEKAQRVYGGQVTRSFAVYRLEHFYFMQSEGILYE